MTSLTWLALGVVVCLGCLSLRSWHERAQRQRYWIPLDEEELALDRETLRITGRVLHVSMRHEGDVPTGNGNWAPRQLVTWEVVARGRLIPFQGRRCEGDDPFSTPFSPQEGDRVTVEFVRTNTKAGPFWRPDRVLPHKEAM